MGNITQLKQGSLNGLRRQTNECLDSAYNKGYQDGKKGFEVSNGQVEYNKGYNSAINDYNMMIQWLHDCRDDFKEFIDKKYGYDVMYLTNPKVDEGVMLYDLICDHDIAEVISEFKKRQEEKKKVEEIKVGDIVRFKGGQNIVVTKVRKDRDNIDGIDANGDAYCIESFDFENLDKVGHMDEVEQLLNKLEGE